MKSSAIEANVIKRLRAHGFRADRIPRDVIKTADIFASARGVDFLVEVTSRNFADQQRATYAKTNRVDGTMNMVPSTSLIDTLRHSVEQLRTSQKAFKTAFPVLWIVIVNKETPELSMRQLVMSLYGIQELQCWRGGFSYELDCFWFKESLFDSSPDLPLAVVEYEGALTFCVNDQSPAAQPLMDTPFWEFPKKETIVPDERYKNLSAASALPRLKSSEATLQRIGRRHGFRTIDCTRRVEYFGLSREYLRPRVI